MSLNFQRMRDRLQQFDFHRLFVEELGWSQPSSTQPASMTANQETFTCRQIAQLADVPVFEINSESGAIPDAKTRAAVHKDITRLHHENLLIFMDTQRTKSLWYWAKRQNGKAVPRVHHYFKGQPGDLFLSKLGAIVFDLSDFDEVGDVSVVEVIQRLRKALDVEPVTKKFYGEFYEQHLAFVELICGVEDDQQKRWYASVLLNRLMFIYFLQRKGFINHGNLEYLQNKLIQSCQHGKDRYFSDFLKKLFFEGFAKPPDQRSPEANQTLGEIPYLNGGLFLPHSVEQNNAELDIPDQAFENLFTLFGKYTWNLNDTPGGLDDEINPDVLGYIFEKYINQKAFGAYYTRTEITEYLCEQTIHCLILDAVNTPAGAPLLPGEKPRQYDSIAELLMDLDATLCRKLLLEVLPHLSLLDPACGSGAFLVAAMKTLIKVYSAITGKIKFLNDRTLSDWLSKIERDHHLNYYIKKTIITDNLYGVDLMEEAVEIAKLRLFLALVAAAERVEQLEPLPNIDFNILAGNSLIGLMRVDEKEFEKRTEDSLLHKSYRQLLQEKNRLIHTFRHATAYAKDLTALRDDIQEKKAEALLTLNQLLLQEFESLKIKYEQATWDVSKNEPGKPIKRPIKIEDIQALHPFHWGYEFDEILNQRGGFDAIITNPPWEIFKPNAKEFFENHSDLVTKKKMTIKEFEKEQAKLLKDQEILSSWLEYLSGYPHLSSYFRAASQYQNQSSVVNGKKTGSDLNLYKLFTEQCFNLLRKGGQCGIVIPSGIYTDLGAKGLRELLFNQTDITGLFCFENRKAIFEGVDSRFKFVVLTYCKGGKTGSFSAAFMRHDVAELERFPQDGAIEISVDLIRKLSPDSLSVMEFKNSLELSFAQRIAKHPPLDSPQSSYKHIRFARELDPTAHPQFFTNKPDKRMVPLIEGRNIHQFTSCYSTQFRFWIRESAARQLLLGRTEDTDQTLDYQTYRLGFRKIARNTDERTMIATIIPSGLASENLQTSLVLDSRSSRLVSNADLLLLAAVFNSFVFDAIIRMKVTANMNFFFVYSTQVPIKGSALESSIVDRAARLICTTPEFDDLAKEVGLAPHPKQPPVAPLPQGEGVKYGVIDPAERAKLRAELDGMVAHLYGLTEEEFTHILSTFPLVDQTVKDAALEAYKTFAPKTADEQVAALISQGESATLEFKSSARWDIQQNQVNKALEAVVVKTVAAFLNSEGGTLLIGVDDHGNILGLQHDYQTLAKKPDRDGYENWLTTKLLGEFGKDCSPLIHISFHPLNNKEICQVAVNRAPKPCFVKDKGDEVLFIRAGNSTRQLNSRETVEYAKQHWG